MNEHYVPSYMRDYCAHDLIPLAECRRKKGPWPWTCKPEKHDYEVCQFEMYKYRKALKEYLVKTGQWNKGQFPEIEPHQK
eukprot:CAMPEP_0114431908 /NCGR_PEP_ID=MMETSP0103-20121206/10868_1 /TAXON_ID=37642 ORGANISM="Paraphysomonas imperforata, Strain PA2" /NCGR_SAMPLE_ID=MMETSP0103 /ASSEMBLY_ACC=CAM_ASM_000201 /LENGTH=79 /DNA_ID=CAMNT_0001601539 /DNA_START=96 /DNA_END=335 /DNA_ORIENTATION=+